jgi:nucleoside phosphorylase/tetratricopeptide (TPR) repeat protein
MTRTGIDKVILILPLLVSHGSTRNLANDVRHFVRCSGTPSVARPERDMEQEPYMAQPASPTGDDDRPPPTVGIVAALWIEGLAMRSLMEDARPLPSMPQDPNHYYAGTLPSTEEGRPHQVVVTILPRDNTRNAAAISTDLIRTFPSVQCLIMTGIAGGIPAPGAPDRHVRLGDVVVATKGVVDYGHLIHRDGVSSARRQMDGMSHELARAANELAAKVFEGVRPWDDWLNVRKHPRLRNFARPPEQTDLLYIRGEQVLHPPRKASKHPRGKPKIHYAAIGSADILLRDEVLRDQIAQEYGVVAVEMEGSGIAVGSATHGRQWFMVRGISDYCENAGKTDSWQPYASLAAAAYVRAVLHACHPFTRSAAGQSHVPRATEQAVTPSTAGSGTPAPQPRSDKPSGSALDNGRDDFVTWRDRLVNSLMGVAFWQQIANRRNLVTLLMTFLADLPELADQNARTHLAQIVGVCMARPDGLAALRASLLAMPATSQVDGALRLIDTVSVADLLPAGYLARLRDPVQRAETDVQVIDLWKDLPAPAIDGSAVPGSLTAAIDQLLTRRGSEATNVAALLGAVSYLGSQVSDAAREQPFTQWLDGVKRHFDRLAQPGTTPGDVEARVQQTGAENVLNSDLSPKAGSRMTDMEKPTSSVATMTPPPSERMQPERYQESGSIGQQGRMAQERIRHDPPAVWNVPPRNLNFTGREELLANLHTQLTRGDLAAVLPQALHGLGGVGKTQLAIEYVYRHQSDYDVIWWIPAEQPQQILSALTELAQHLGLNVGPEANTAVPAVKEALRKGEPYANWLLVFDNAEDADSVEQSIPTGGIGKVLVTSRNAEWMIKAQSLEVDVFDRSESINLLRRRDSQITDESAFKLAEALGDLPLAIEQAAAWRAATGMGVEEYLTLLEAKRPELLGSTATAGYDRSVAAVWTVSLDKLEQINPAALQLLEVAAFFAPEPIARSLFATPRQPITPELDEALRDPIKLGRALRDIQRFALAKVDHRTDTVQLHRLVQAVLLARIPADQHELYRHGAHELLAAANPRQPVDSRNWPRYSGLISHVKVSDGVHCQEPWVRDLVFDLVRYLYQWGDHQGCQELAQNIFETWQVFLGADHPESLRIAKYLGYILGVNGEFSRAKEIFEDTLGRYERTVAGDDEDLIDTKLMLAYNLRAAGRSEESLALNTSVFADCRRVYTEDDPFRLRAANDLGVSLRFAGKYREALSLDAETIRIRAQVLGENHYDTLNTTNGLTIDLRESGDYRGAREAQEKLYAQYVTLFGDGNPATVRAGRNLAVARRRAGEHEGALELSSKVEYQFRQRYGPGSSDAMAAALNLAADLRQNKDLPGSADCGATVLEEYRQALGESHPFTYAARTNLAVTLRLMDKIEDAHEHNVTAAAGMAEALGPLHVSALICAINLASDKYTLEDHQAAFELDVETLESVRVLLGPDHPTTLACNANLALDLRALGRVGEANAVHADVVARFQRTLGERHPATVGAIHNVRADCDIDPMPL